MISANTANTANIAATAHTDAHTDANMTTKDSYCLGDLAPLVTKYAILFDDSEQR